jgi:hypothetical protein
MEVGQGYRIRTPSARGTQDGARSGIRGPSRPQSKALKGCSPDQNIQQFSDLTAAIGLLRSESSSVQNTPVSTPQVTAPERARPTAPSSGARQYQPSDNARHANQGGSPSDTRSSTRPANNQSTSQAPTNPTPEDKTARGENTLPPPLPPPQEIPQLPAPGNQPPNEDVNRDVSNATDAIEVQKRLIELGFLNGVADGKWGARSKLALLGYKAQAGLENNDAWNQATERSLFSPAAPHAVRTYSFIGGWTNEKGQCGAPGEPAPLRITIDRAESDLGMCKFNSVQPDGSEGWRIDAACSSVGENPHAAHIRLAVREDVLQWSSERPTTLYYRCENSR